MNNMVDFFIHTKVKRVPQIKIVKQHIANHRNRKSCRTKEDIGINRITPTEYLQMNAKDRKTICLPCVTANYKYGGFRP